jgi:DNA-binding MarR family transcriptional regulator
LIRVNAMPAIANSAPAACACGRLRRAARALTQLYDDAMAPAGVRITQFSLLRTLARSGPMRISDLAAAQLLDRTALSRNLDPLVERRLVKVARGTDARTRDVELTRAGRAVLRLATPHWQRAQAEVAKRLGNAKLDALIAVLGDVEALHPDSVVSGAKTKSVQASAVGNASSR